jgi:acyl-CoA thioesterase I
MAQNCSCKGNILIKPINTIKKLQTGVPVTIAALGDSLTQGWMVPKGYIDFVEEMLNARFPESDFKIINSGIPGDTADYGLQRLKRDVLNYLPDCVFIQYALNDAFSGFSKKEFKGYVKDIIDKIQRAGNPDIILITSGYLGENSDNLHMEEYYQQLESLGEEYGLSIARTHEYWKMKVKTGIELNSLVQYDNVHPTVAGYRLMAEAVMQLFEVGEQPLILS